MNQTLPLNRSKSDDQISTNRSKVLSPTPIRGNSLVLLNHIFELSSGQKQLEHLDFDESENEFAIRKFQSLGPYELHQQLCRSKQFEASLLEEDAPNSENGNNFDMYGSGNSGYFVSEIPTRASNPLIYDARFIETDTLESNESEQHHSYLKTVENDPSSRLEAY